MDWGIRGVEEASKRGDVIVVVDVLSFSSAITTAIHYGAIIYPYSGRGDIKAFGKMVHAEVLLERKEARYLGRPSLSPPSFKSRQHKGKKFVLSSFNGAACSRVPQKVPALLIGCLLNASSVSTLANKLGKDLHSNITVIACGERWSNVTRKEQKELRPAVEDYLGAGAILEKLKGSKSPESELCINAFRKSKKGLKKLLWNCSSGKELREFGFDEDVIFASQVDTYKDVPVLVQEDLDKSYFRSYS
jgi:2-phosphosulfolactate phosphatase